MGNFCLWDPESGKTKLLGMVRIIGIGIRNTAQGIWNPYDWNQESKLY